MVVRGGPWWSVQISKAFNYGDEARPWWYPWWSVVVRPKPSIMVMRPVHGGPWWSVQISEAFNYGDEARPCVAILALWGHIRKTAIT